MIATLTLPWIVTAVQIYYLDAIVMLFSSELYFQCIILGSVCLLTTLAGKNTAQVM